MKPNVEAHVFAKQAQQKKDHDSSERQIDIGSKVLAKRHGEIKLVQFIDSLTIFYPLVEVIANWSHTEVNFLDVRVALKDGFIVTDLYTKLTNKHLYLTYNSCQPPYCTKSIPYRQARHTCSDFIKRSNELFTKLKEKGYPKYTIVLGINKAFKNTEWIFFLYHQQKGRHPFVITYNPILLIFPFTLFLMSYS